MPLIGVSTPEHIPSILTELGHDSDRAAAIVAAVLVEESLTTLIRSRLVPDEDLLHELLRASGPLGAFSVKITFAHLLGLFSPVARRELETIKDIRNEFAHRVARTFAFERIRDLATNLSLCEKIEFHVVPKEDGEMVLYIGAKPPADQPSTPVLPPITPDKLTPRERYLRACQFYSGALVLTANAMPKNFYPVYF
jgi:DNA-binding MltR family transcriptional regulator